MNTVTRASLGVVCVIAIGLSLTACTGPETEPTTTASVTASSSEAPTASPTEQPAGDSVPFQQNCDDLMPASVMFEWNPNYSLNNDGTKAPGSSWDIVEQLQGTNCNFVNQSSGNAVTISVTQLTDSGLSVLQEQIAGTLPEIESADGGTAYFGTVAGSGVFEMFTPTKFWITIAGPDIASAQDIEALKAQILQYLPAG